MTYPLRLSYLLRLFRIFNPFYAHTQQGRLDTTALAGAVLVAGCEGRAAASAPCEGRAGPSTAGCDSLVPAIMPRKKVDARVRTLIENGVKARHRTFLVLVGDRGKDQVSCGRGRRTNCFPATRMR